MKLFFTTAPVPSGEFLLRILALEGIRTPLILRTPNGKPYLRSGELQFNLTHTDGLTAAAAGAVPVGLDAERRKPRKTEAVLRRLTPEERREDFYRLWTAKEAYIKYRGGTAAQMLPRLTYENGLLLNCGQPVSCALTRFEIEGCEVCVCTERKEKFELLRL